MPSAYIHKYFNKEVIVTIVIAFQVLAVLLFWNIGFEIKYQKIIFQNVKEFSPVEAQCVKSRNRWHGDTRYHDNTYQYEVNGKLYSVTFMDENFMDKDFIGSTGTIYYHPDNPNICSKFRSISEVWQHYSLWIVIGMIFQIVVIFYAVTAFVKGRQRKMMSQSIGVVLQDDMDYIIKEKQENDTYMKNREKQE